MAWPAGAAPLQAVAMVAVPPPLVQSAVSRKVHGAAGTFDLALSLDPFAPTVEPRQGATATIVLRFDKPLTGADAAVTEGTASVLGSAISGNDVVVELGGVANAQWVTLTLSNVTSGDGGGGGSGAVRMGFLRGDVSGNRVVTVSDLAQVNAQIAQVVGAGNYLRDVNASGTLTVADKGIANTQITKASPAIGNQAPAVNAGTDQAITLPASASLGGTVGDDGLPNASVLGAAWTKVSGPGTVSFGAPGSAATTASFGEAGIYVLRLTASDGSLIAGDDVQVTVHPQGGTLNVPLPVLETHRAVSATIGSAGGTVGATAADGTLYQLYIPAGALPGPVTITLTPVASLSGLPLSGGLVGAVDLKPSGLRLARTALLRIGKAGTPPAGFTLAGFSLGTGAAAAQRSAALLRATEVAVLVSHFSTHGAGFGTTQDLATLGLPAQLSPSEQAAWGPLIDVLLLGPSLYPAEEIRAAYLSMFDDVVLPMLHRAASDVELLQAASWYWDWKFLITFLFGSPGADAFDAAITPILATVYQKQTSWELLAVTKLRQAIDANNALCRSEQSLAALRNVLFLQSTFQGLIQDNILVANGLDRPVVLRDLCAKLIITQLSLADPLQTTVPSDLDVTFGLKFDTVVETSAVPVRVEFGGSNVSFGKSSPANSDVLGHFTIGVTAKSATQLVTFVVRGCVILFGEMTDVCVLEEVERNRGSVPLPTHWAGTIELEMDWSRLSVSAGGNQRVNYSRLLRASATVDVQLPPGQSVVLPLANVAGTASSATATTIIEEQYYQIDGVNCLYRITYSSVSDGSGNVASFSGLVMKLNASGTYEIGASNVSAFVAEADVLGTTTSESDFTPLPNGDGIVCNDLPSPPPQTDPWSSVVVVSGGELPQVFSAIQAGRLQGAQSVTFDHRLGNPGDYAYEIGTETVTLRWLLDPQ